METMQLRASSRRSCLHSRQGQGLIVRKAEDPACLLDMSFNVGEYLSFPVIEHNAKVHDALDGGFDKG